MDNKYLLVSSEEESNIAVIKCDGQGNFLADQLISALGEHFDFDDVKISSIDEVSKYPLKYCVHYTITDYDDEIQNNVVYLNQTWIY